MEGGTRAAHRGIHGRVQILLLLQLLQEFIQLGLQTDDVCQLLVQNGPQFRCILVDFCTRNVDPVQDRHLLFDQVHHGVNMLAVRRNEGFLVRQNGRHELLVLLRQI